MGHYLASETDAQPKLPRNRGGLSCFHSSRSRKCYGSRGLASTFRELPRGVAIPQVVRENFVISCRKVLPKVRICSESCLLVWTPCAVFVKSGTARHGGTILPLLPVLRQECVRQHVVMQQRVHNG